MQICSQFDSGNIEVIDATDPGNLQLRIRKDNASDFLQWFHFRLTGARGRCCVLNMVNGHEATYPDGYRDYWAVASYDRQHWFRVPTDFDGRVLAIRHTPERDSVYYAYFAPYSMERHADLIARCLAFPRASLEVLGETLDGQPLELLRIGEPAANRRSCWIIGRQHPGETMAEWWMEGFLDRLTDPDHAVARVLLEKAVFYMVPNMNPDGSRRGHLRTNAAGVNLNREWLEPSLERSPEVFLVRARMHETGVDFCLDVHGDESLPYNFIVGFEGIPSVTAAQLNLLEGYQTRLAELNPEFQTSHGYPRNAPAQANLTMSTNYIAETFGCLAITLEQPFKDAANLPNPATGWSPARCRRLASACLDALYSVVDRLR